MLPERRHEVSRLEAFSDAAFAFALTLLVVSLDVPQSYGQLMQIMRGFPSFACCFALLVWIWFAGHHLVSATVGLMALLVVVAGPLTLAFMSPCVLLSWDPATGGSALGQTSAAARCSSPTD